MARHSVGKIRVAALTLICAGGVVAIPAPAPAQNAVTREAPGDALARNLRALAVDSRDFKALIGAGRATLAMGDTQAAAGFFGRAEEVWPASPLPQAGMGAALVGDGDAAGALIYFQRAAAKGASALAFAADRGLAFDLLGRHAEAQADYRTALQGADADEARRRLALSLAISGDKTGALAALGPLVARGDAGGARCRALVLALSGDADGARRAMDAAMPGSGLRMDPFFRRLPTLRTNQKAAAVHLGIFPDWSNAALASAIPAGPPLSGGVSGGAAGGDRLRSIDELLAGATNPPPVAYSLPSASRVAASRPPASRPSASAPVVVYPPARMAAVNRAAPPRTQSVTSKRHWVQLASGANSAALPTEFRRIRSRKPAMFDGISGYVAVEADRARLLIGPFGSSDDANIFAQALEEARIDAFSWTNKTGEPIRKLPNE